MDVVGDGHLWALLLVHDVLTHRGVAAAAEILSVHDVAQAVIACRYAALNDLAGLLTGMLQAALSPQASRAFDAQYRRLLPAEALTETVRREQPAAQ